MTGHAETLTAAVVVAWHQPDLTIRALQSLAAMDVPPQVLVCVAQEFTALEMRQLRAEAPERTQIIVVDRNRGFCGGANLGIAAALEAGVDWVLLVNNDATVSPTCLGRCLDETRREAGVAVVGPAISLADSPGRLWYAGGRHSRHFAFTRHRGLRQTSANLPPSSDTDYVPGCCALISALAWRAVGPFREDYFAYYEDAEWGSRARALGWRCRYVGELLCAHDVGVSSQQRGSLGLSENTAYYLARNPLRFALETPSVFLRASRVTGLMTIWSAYNAWRVVRSGQVSVGGSYLRGLRDAVRGRMGPKPA
jgi:GT2 family glycosyltransferase